MDRSNVERAAKYPESYCEADHAKALSRLAADIAKVERTPPFAVGQRVMYIGRAMVQNHDGQMVAFYGHTGTIDRIVKSKREAVIRVEDGPGGGPREAAFFRAEWSNLTAQGGAA